MGISQRSVQVHSPVMSVFEKLFSIKKIHFKRSVIFVVNQKGGVGKICFIIICEIRWVNSSIYMFFLGVLAWYYGTYKEPIMSVGESGEKL